MNTGSENKSTICLAVVLLLLLPASLALSASGQWREGLSDEMAKQRARLQLEQMTTSEGLIDLILGSEGWMDIWVQIKQGTLSLKDLEEQFYKTAAGAKELEDAAKAAAQAQEEYDKAVAAINAKLEEDLKLIAERAREVKNVVPHTA